MTSSIWHRRSAAVVCLVVAAATLLNGCTTSAKKAVAPAVVSTSAQVTPTPTQAGSASAIASPVGHSLLAVGTAAAGGAEPSAVAVDTATHTVYVGTDGGLSVINAATCNATVSSSCGQTSETMSLVPGGSDGIAIDQLTDTIYALDPAESAVAVVNGKTCNAIVTSGCGQQPLTIAVGGGPDGVAIDQLTDTVYVANSGDNTVSIIDGATCNGIVTTGCAQTVPTIAVNNSPAGLAVNELTNTVYVANANDGTMSVIDGATCDATVTTGCGQTPPAIGLGNDVSGLSAAVDPATDTVYAVAAGSGLGAVAVINGATCNATTTDGCEQVPTNVTVGGGPVGVAFDPTSRQVFVVNQADGTMSVINAATCNAAVTAGCAGLVPEAATGANPGSLDVDAATGTVYVTNQDNDDVSVLGVASCTLTNEAGCRHAASTTAIGSEPAGAAVDQATGTIYVANHDDGDLSVINSATCNAADTSGCGKRWPTVAVGANPMAVAVDQTTDTIYTANGDPQNNADGSTSAFVGSTVSVVGGAHCNATVVSGCAKVGVAVNVGQGPSAIAVDEVTDTVYVADFNDGTVSVIDGATCNGAVTTGCAHKAVTVAVGRDPEGIAVDQVTDTIYVSNNTDNTVSVIDGATCNATVTTSCGTTASTVDVGKGPLGIGVDTATDTVYVANFVSNDVSVIDGATCNATVQSGCDQKPPTMTSGPAPKRGVAVDQTTGAVFVDAYSGAVVDVFNGSSCNATVSSGCTQQPTTVPTGGDPVYVAFDAANNTVYASDNADDTMSFFAAPA